MWDCHKDINICYTFDDKILQYIDQERKKQVYEKKKKLQLANEK